MLSLVVMTFFFSCSNQKKDQKVIDFQINKSASFKINKIKSRTINSIHDQTIYFSDYHNKTGNKKSIGEVVNQDLKLLAPVNNNNRIVKETREPGSHSFVNENPVFNKTMWLLVVTFDNDIFDNTDYYYTNGIRINLAIPALRLSPVNNIFPSPKNRDIEFCGLSLVQNMYTPTNPDTKDILYGDRPFSAYLTLGMFREVYDLSHNIYIKSQISLGVLGPSSLGGQVQSSIHEITPMGWQNQISNDFVINYSVTFKKGLVNSSVFDLNLDANASVGSLYDKIGGGFDLRFGSFMPFYQGPISVFEHPDSDNRLQCWFFVRSSVQLVVFDATLQGGLFNYDDIYTIDPGDVKRIVFQTSGGFALYHKNMGVEFENYFLSPEFKGARNFGWGRINAVLAF